MTRPDVPPAARLKYYRQHRMGVRGFNRRRTGLALAAAALVLAALAVGGCSIRESFRPETHLVARGDTLYSIAWHYGLDWHALAHWNHIEPPFVIHPGQVLSLDPFGPVPTRSGAPDEATGTTSVAKRQPGDGAGRSGHTVGHTVGDTVTYRIEPPSAPTVVPLPPPGEVVGPAPKSKPEAKPEPKPEPPPSPPTDAAQGPLRWRWPVPGPILHDYSAGEPRNGIDIGGEVGDPVVAAAGGHVVYSGNGLKGYGNLIIIKHNERYLSAYGFNRELLVEQGETVSAGDKIAEIGLGPKRQPMLHFEVRRDGEPLDPRRVLPQR